jgi:hypothetical protein
MQSSSNNGFASFIYIPKKQNAFIVRDYLQYSPRFRKFVREGGLDLKKQRATYVGFEKSSNSRRSVGKLSVPKRIRAPDAKQLISLVNASLLEIAMRVEGQGDYFSIEPMDKVIRSRVTRLLKTWKNGTRLKSRRSERSWLTRLSRP